MRPILASLLLLVPLAGHAADRCAFEAPRNMSLDLAGVRAVQIEVNSYDLHVTGRADARKLDVEGRACASDHDLLDQLVVTQRREGDQLILELGSGRGFHLFGGDTELEVTVQLPASLPLTVDVGSGDAEVSGVRALDSRVGSGDLHVRNVSGRFATSVGSGDVEANDVGGLEVGSVGSGDLSVSGVNGEARVGSIGSGDVRLRDVRGSVRADSLGSGDLDVDGVGGDLSLGAKGSGDVSHSGVKGKVDVPRDDD
jgi:Putative auto-transporter adhesin, head GIN domain